MLSNDDHDALVGLLYASALGEAPWAATLQHLSDLFRVSSSVLQVLNPATEVIAVENHGYSLEFAARFFASEAYAKDPRLPYFRRVRPGTLYYDHALYDLEEMDRNPWCRESIATLKVKYQLGAVTELPGGMKGYLTLLSSEAEGHPSESAISAYRRLAPHVEQALSLGHVLENHSATQVALLEAFAEKADGIVLLDPAGIATFMNDAARAILASADGFAYSDGKFVACRGPETRALQRMIGDALAGPAPAGARSRGQILITRPSGKWPYMVRVLGAPRSERFLSGTSIGCVVHLHDLASVRLPSREVLGAAFGLTERETDLAVELVRCAALAGAAANCGMALNTGRNHLHGILVKSGTRSQAELIRLLSALP